MSAIVAAFLFFSACAVQAQTDSKSKPYPASPGLVPINRPSLPTGELASFAQLSKSVGVLQPIQWKLPEGAVASVAQEGGYESDPSGVNEFGVRVGYVYRFRIDAIPYAKDKALYPTLEVFGRLNPPEGKEWDFPVEIEVPQEDLDLALNGSFVTRVVFLENSENAANLDSNGSTVDMTLDVPAGVDPVVAAGTRGRAIAILRLGSRELSDLPSADNPFFFGLPKVEFRTAVSEIANEVEVDVPEDAVK